MGDSGEVLPGDWSVSYRQIQAWRSGEAFDVFDDEGNRHRIDPADPSPSEFAYYFRVWERCHHFGLPGGAGWRDEPEWLLDLVREFDIIFKDIEVYRTKRRGA